MTNEQRRERYAKRRDDLIRQLGGVCVKCESTERLQFDHIDPRTKEFEVTRRIRDYSMERLQIESAKCQLLCLTCHQNKTITDLGQSRVETHGTRVMYLNKGCRCNECRAAQTAYVREYRKTHPRKE